ncbi:MAG TPA: J domain-containing protein [Phototrophicaceae bacterium]|jgi:hypothetical protein|nr:J domain-containing protein [Phototrophicaceae bacterium]
MVRFDTYNASAHLVRLLEESGKVDVVHDGGDNLLVQLLTGEQISIYLIETVMPPYEIRQTLLDNNTVGIHTLFVLWGEMFLRENGTVLVPDEWIRALSVLYNDKVYAFGVYGKDIHIFPVYFEKHGFERILRYGEAVNVALLAGEEVIVTGSVFEEFQGKWRIADFSGHKPPARQSHQPKGKPLTPVARRTPWEILGITPQSDREKIKQAYRKLARIYHPDVNRSQDAHNRMQILNEAYDTILRQLEDSG